MKFTVMRVDKSPLNPKRKCVELACGHEIGVNRAPRVGSEVECVECTAAKKADPEYRENARCGACL